MNLNHLPIVDHHAHPLLRNPLTSSAKGFSGWFTESTSPQIFEEHVPHSLVFRTALTWLAELLECDVTQEAVVAARSALEESAWVRRLFQDANIDMLLCDYGYGSADAYDHEEMQALVPCRVEPILRLETLAERLIVAYPTFDQMVDAYAQQVGQARSQGYVALKSIIAYRTGLDIAPTDAADAALAFAGLKESARRRGQVRLACKPLCDYLLELALAQADRQQLPVQFHTGFGDSDADLRWANPLHLRRIVEQYAGVPLVLLHAGWPYYRELAHLAAIYPNVWMDLSLAVPFATVGIPGMIRDVLGMAPFSKVLFATDAYTMPEIYWVAARWGRWGLARVLDELVADGFLSDTAAQNAAAQILGGNARRLYLGET